MKERKKELTVSNNGKVKWTSLSSGKVKSTSQDNSKRKGLCVRIPKKSNLMPPLKILNKTVAFVAGNERVAKISCHNSYKFLQRKKKLLYFHYEKVSYVTVSLYYSIYVIISINQIKSFFRLSFLYLSFTKMTKMIWFDWLVSPHKLSVAISSHARFFISLEEKFNEDAILCWIYEHLISL